MTAVTTGGRDAHPFDLTAYLQELKGWLETEIAHHVTEGTSVPA